MSFSIAVKDIAEVFLFRTEAIHFLGTLIALNDGRTMVSGRVRFYNGEKIAFSSAPDDPATLSETLMSTCQNIAEFFNAEVIHEDLRGADGNRRN